LTAGIDSTVDLLAPAQGASVAQTEAETLIEVHGVAGLIEYATVERVLDSVPGVRRANIIEANAATVTFDVTVRGGAEALDRALAGSNRLARSGTDNARLVYQYRP